jgi:hypothetical protein
MTARCQVQVQLEDISILAIVGTSLTQSALHS